MYILYSLNNTHAMSEKLLCAVQLHHAIYDRTSNYNVKLVLKVALGG